MMKTIFFLAVYLMLNVSNAEHPDMAMISLTLKNGEKKVAAPSVVMPAGERGQMSVGQEIEDPTGRLVNAGVTLEAEWRMREDGFMDVDLIFTLRNTADRIYEADATLQPFTSEEYVVSGIAESRKPVVFKLDDTRSLTLTVIKLDPKGVTYQQMIDPRQINGSNSDNSPDYNDEGALQRIRGKE